MFASRSHYIVILLWVVLTGSSTAQARSCKYDVHSDGNRLGVTRITIQDVSYDGRPATEITTHTHLRAKALFLTLYELEIDEICLLNDEGLISFESQSVVNGDKIVVQGHRGSKTLDFEIDNDGDQQTVTLPLEGFDYTSADEPLSTLVVCGQPVTYRILDLDRLEVLDRTFTWVHDEILDIEGRPVPCAVIDVTDSSGPGRRWLTKDGLNTLVKAEGVDEGEPFRIVITQSPLIRSDSQ